ncbi:MAG: aldehyde dehydrogenase family protein [Tissierellia bacterium]|nr:aldehyde dehydrogenase family protein [Tissierellia bacterium]
MLEKKFDKIDKIFKSNVTKDFNYRKKKLLKLKENIIRNEQKIFEALKKDLGKSKSETYMSEYKLVIDEINFMKRNLKKFMKVKRVFPSKGQLFSKIRIINEPLGKILIISPWNYPFLLSMIPIIGAVASGNVFILKPSEFSKNTSLIVKDIIKSTFGEEYIVLGDKKVNEQLLKFDFDHIFFTGNSEVGKIIMKKASEKLIPVTLELGGKSPVIVDSNIDIEKTAKRILFGKLLNRGQTCVSPDFIYCDQKIVDQLVINLKRIYKKMIPNEAYSKSQAHIIDRKHLNDLIDKFDAKDDLFMPLDIKIVKKESKLLESELFCPILPILTYEDKVDVIDYLYKKPAPLSLYIFSNDKKFIKYILENTKSGGVCINDTIVHMISSRAPFGGIGYSGMGNYHGYYSFKTFSQQKTIVKRSLLFDFNFRYHPFDQKKYKKLRRWM